MAELIVTYKITEYIDVDVKDFELSEEDLHKLANSKAKYVIPGIAEDVDWYWRQEPKSKDSQRLPPDDYWFDSILGQTAGNNIIFVSRDFPIPANYAPIRNWLDPRTTDFLKIEELNTLFSRDIASMSLHCGYFNSSFACFKEIDGLQVLGDNNSSEAIGYMVLNGKIVGILMPVALPRQDKGDFQFSFQKN